MNWYLTQVINQDGTLIPMIYQTEEVRVTLEHMKAGHFVTTTKPLYTPDGNVWTAYEDDPIVEGTNVLIGIDGDSFPPETLATEITDWVTFKTEHPKLVNKIPGQPNG